MRSENIQKSIYITEQDLENLILLLDIYILRNNDQEDHIEKLINNLDKANIIDEELVTDELVIINSRVSVTDLDSKKRLTFDLLSSEVADLADGNLSVLAPMGAAVLGCRTGDIIELSILKRNKRFKIEGVLHKRQNTII
ncbi:MAG: GreA/GreB family elongation factor [bacterium]